MDHIIEARRYLENARDLLSEKAGKEDGIYQDTKYVKMAGHTAYVGVLLALDLLLGRKSKGRKDVEWYKKGLTLLDKKLVGRFSAAYETLHQSMGYDGNPDAGVANAGLTNADQIINWVETRMESASLSA